MMCRSRLTLDALPDLPLVQAGDNLGRMLGEALGRIGGLVSGDVVVIAQKIVSKAEGRARRLSEICPGYKARELSRRCGKPPALIQLVLDESEEILRAAAGVLVVRHRLGHVMANAGIDQSNLDHDGGEMALLLPQNPDASAQALRQALEARFGVDIGVVIADSFGRPWRIGTTGVCIGSAGLAPLVDLRGTADLFGRTLHISQQAIGDEIAAAASLLLGQGAEAQPAVRLRGLGTLGRGTTADLIRARDEDLFR